MRKQTLMAGLCAFLAWTLHAQETGIVAETVRGEGPTQRDAVCDAVERVLAAQCGMTIGVGRQTQAVLNEHSVAKNGRETFTSVANDTFERAVKTSVQGRIAGFHADDTQWRREGGNWVNDAITVQVHSRYVVGRDPDRLRRMVVADFVVRNMPATVFGKPVAKSELSARLGEKLTDALTQTRKFTMLDRKFSQQVEAELARVSLPNASSADMGRLGQQLATDYLVVGTVDMSDPPSAVANPFTGLATAPVATLLEVHYRVLLAPTGQLKWADTVAVSSAETAGATVDEYLSMLCMQAAQRIADGMMENILPFIVVGKNDKEIIIGQGAKSLLAGEEMNVYNPGAMLTDPRTGEKLGRDEQLVARVRITRVLPKLSYATVIKGDLESIADGATLRRDPDAAATPPAHEPPQTRMLQTRDGAVVTPF